MVVHIRRWHAGIGRPVENGDSGQEDPLFLQICTGSPFSEDRFLSITKAIVILGIILLIVWEKEEI
jgi:hypothetical protein